MAKREQNLIKLDEFNIQQLPELQNKKKEVSAKISTFKYVEIKDNSSYEEAKKVRTGVRTIRTDLQKEQKSVDKKIKDFILGPAKEAYEEIINAVIDVENIQQEEVTRWEDIKEKERQEKLLLEQQRFEGIKKCILEFKSAWLETVDRLLYPEIGSFLPMLEDVVSKMDRTKFEEFEILFDDVLFEIKAVFKRKADLLRANEELRLERERFAEIQEEQKRVDVIKAKIDNFDKQWNQRINLLEYSKIKEVSKFFEEETALDCQEFQPVYADIRKKIQEALFLKVSKLSTQEKERVERENFLKEKADFEAKQLEAKFQERKKFLVDEDYWRIYLLAECGDVEEVAKTKLSNFSDSDFEDFKLAVLKSKELVSITKKEPIKADGYSTSEEKISVEQTENYHEEVIIFKDGVSEVSEEVAEVMNTFNKVDEEIINEVDSEETWDSIQEDYRSKWTDYDSLFKYLKDNYNVPTKK